ncbi:RecName: Full CASP-like protein 4D1 Short RcCASPL4D1 [Tripterygium wilfordii]|uniref:CASP-like protein n=1 Tax=Tripterygium wilfordii TaxID=458696 RepID=A0A7J7C645_TRIWF|nr:CASP-like protein 4D1 [Tripterygium wilfordii]KAF5729588.1 RecName: Full CASP-like protein 4D1 Short RcCASPL4D1 [Tripterygium wilfordii]
MAQPPAPPPPSAASRVTILVLRTLTFVFLFVSLVVITTSTATLEVDIYEFKVHFKDVYAYRYMLATIVIGMAYMILQIGFMLYNVVTGNRLMAGDRNLLFDFYGDKVISYLLATGAAAAFGSTKDMKPLFSGSGDVDKFFNKGYVSASLLLLGFVCTAILSVLSSYALPKKV